MGRPRLLLPLLTTALPFVAGAAPWFHGALAGLLAIVSPLLVDLVTSRSGGTTWRAGDDEAPAPARYYAVLFHLYAGGFLFFFARFVLTSPSLSPEDVIGRAFSWVVLAGVPTLIVGHALIHQRAKTARVIGQSLFSLLNYPDFPRLHVEMHHRHVATDPDHHSAPKDQTFYRFFVHSLVGELTSIPRAGQRMRSALLLALQAALLVAITGFAGPRALLVFLVTTFLARGVVALVNYVQHYGLERRPGQKVGEEHAWDLPYKSGNWLYFNAGFHADHHIKASTDAAALVLRSTTYTLPHNIPIILPLALLPPLFFRTMNPLLGGAQRQLPLGSHERPGQHSPSNEQRA